jgi:hypothetical protein
MTMPANYPNYNPVGALNNTFAPAYIPGYAPSEQAVMQRQQTRGLQGIQNQGVQYLEELQSPRPQGPNAFAQGSYDPAMLRALAQNLPYDVSRRRSEIADVLAARNSGSIPGIGPQLEAALRAAGQWPPSQAMLTQWGLTGGGGQNALTTGA